MYYLNHVYTIKGYVEESRNAKSLSVYKLVRDSIISGLCLVGRPYMHTQSDMRIEDPDDIFCPVGWFMKESIQASTFAVNHPVPIPYILLHPSQVHRQTPTLPTNGYTWELPRKIWGLGSQCYRGESV